jgi:hypothetical protein
MASSKEGEAVTLSLAGVGKVPKRLQRHTAPVHKAALGVSDASLKGPVAQVNYVKGIVGNKVDLVSEKANNELVIPLARNPWEVAAASGTDAETAAALPVDVVAAASSNGGGRCDDGGQHTTAYERRKGHSSNNGAAAQVAATAGETEGQRLDREAAAALLSDATGGGEGGADEPRNNSFRILMGEGESKDMSQLERVMAHKKAFEKDEGTGKVLSEKEKLQKEMAMRPAANDFTSESYDQVPIEHFGRAMLLGMGWVPPEKGGNDANKAHLVEARPVRLGLGATAKPWEQKRNDDPSKTLKPGEERHKVSASCG